MSTRFTAATAAGSSPTQQSVLHKMRLVLQTDKLDVEKGKESENMLGG